MCLGLDAATTSKSGAGHLDIEVLEGGGITFLSPLQLNIWSRSDTRREVHFRSTGSGQHLTQAGQFYSPHATPRNVRVGDLRHTSAYGEDIMQ